MRRLGTRWLAPWFPSLAARYRDIPTGSAGPGAGRPWAWSGTRERWFRRRTLARACALVPAILAATPSQGDATSPSTWRIQTVDWARTDTIIIMVGPADQPPRAVLKLPQTYQSLCGVRRQEEVLGALHADSRLGEWRSLLPKQLAGGEIAGQPYVAHHALAGVPGQRLLGHPATGERVLGTALGAIRPLHWRTASPAVIDETRLERWIDRPIRRLNAGLPRASRDRPALARLAAELRGTLAGRTLPTGWIHGDYWSGNLLVTPDGGEVRGIVDWDLAAPDELPLHDVLHPLLYTRCLVQRRELGDVVRTLLHGRAWAPEERSLFTASALALSGDATTERAMVLLYWLRHVAAVVSQYPPTLQRRWWFRKNVEAVLRCL
jgi:hypothetical protein